MDKIRQILEEVKVGGKDIDESVINDIIAQTSAHAKKYIKYTDNTELIIQELKKELDSETDWKKKSAIAAKIISMNV